jgi:alkanesulfonate monooxygenase SsuD/methylene tetrahydromethanopterin reductase-like flavin-dependent oxidoreductase (luciferase family)
MRFSLFYNFDILPGKSIPALYREIEEQAILADTLGFDAIWLAEHHFELYGRLPAPLTYLARLSGLTRRIGLGTAVVEAPYYHPLRLAEDAALLDILSSGRVRLGIGSGARNKPEEFATFGIPLEEKAARTRETIEILHQAFEHGTVNVDGDYFRYQTVAVNPRPIQSANRLIWLAASDSTVELAGQRGYPLLIPRVGVAERHQELVRRYRTSLAGQPGFVAQLRFVYAAETERAAHERTRQTFGRYAGYDCGVTWDGRTDSAEYADLTRRMHFVIGTPDQVAAQVSTWQREYGFDELICQVYAAGMEHADTLRAIELLGREVLPQLQTELLKEKPV